MMISRCCVDLSGLLKKRVSHFLSPAHHRESKRLLYLQKRKEEKQIFLEFFVRGTTTKFKKEHIYDNIIAGGPEDQVDALWTKIHARLQHYKALVKDGSDVKAVRGGSLDALGLRWLPSVKGLRWTLLPKFVKKVGVLKLSELWSCRIKDISSVMGLLTWGRYATRSDLCDLQQAYSTLAADVAAHSWRGSTTPSKYCDVFDKLAALQGFGWQQHSPAVNEVLPFTDAHNISGYGHVGGSPLTCTALRWPIGSVFLPKDMYYLEAVGLKQTVLTYARPNRRMFVASDNRSLVLPSIRLRKPPAYIAPTATTMP